MSEHTDDADVRPEDLTSPHTVDDPKLEQQRAEEAAERERESRASEDTKFEEARADQEAERAQQVESLGDLPAPTDEH